MTGLTILLVATDDDRLRAALTLAISNAALGGRTRLYAHEGAVSALIPATAPAPALAAGQPGRADLLVMAQDTGVELIACQTGLAQAGIGLDQLVPGVVAGGLMSVLADLGTDRLITF